MSSAVLEVLVEMANNPWVHAATLFGAVGVWAIRRAFHPSAPVLESELQERKDASDGDYFFLRLQDGSFVEWYEFGATRSGSVLVMLHGINSTGKLWKVADDFGKKNNIRIICPSLPGWGLSSAKRNLGPFEWARTDMTNLLVDHLKLGKIYVFGASLGSIYAAALATALGEHKVKGLMLYVAFAPKSRTHEPLKGSVLRGFQRIHQRFPILMQVLDQYILLPMFRVLTDDSAHTFRQWEGLWKGRETIFHPWDFSLADVPSARCEVLVVSGTKDVIAPRRNQELLQQSIRGSKLVKYEGTHEHSLLNPHTLHEHLAMLLHTS